MTRRSRDFSHIFVPPMLLSTDRWTGDGWGSLSAPLTLDHSEQCLPPEPTSSTFSLSKPLSMRIIEHVLARPPLVPAGPCAGPAAPATCWDSESALAAMPVCTPAAETEHQPSVSSYPDLSRCSERSGAPYAGHLLEHCCLVLALSGLSPLDLDRAQVREKLAGINGRTHQHQLIPLISTSCLPPYCILLTKACSQSSQILFPTCTLQAVCRQWRDVASLLEVRSTSFCAAWGISKVIASNQQRDWACLQVGCAISSLIACPMFTFSSSKPYSSLLTLGLLCRAVPAVAPGLCAQAPRPAGGEPPVHCREARRRLDDNQAAQQHHLCPRWGNLERVPAL